MKLFCYRWYNMQLLIFCHAWGGMLREFSGTKVKTGASETGEFTAGCWSRHSLTLRRRSGGLTMTRHSLQPGCPLFSRVIDWGKRLLFVFLSLFDLAEWGIMVPILASKNTHSVTFIHREHTIKDHRKQQCLPSVFSL